MLSKEKYLKALDELVRYADIGRQRHGATGCDIDSYVSVREALLCELISEHFNPSAYKFEELEDGMWVWDTYFQCCCYVGFIVNENCVHISYLDGYISDGKFKENRFYPLTKANQEKEVKV